MFPLEMFILPWDSSTQVFESLVYLQVRFTQRITHMQGLTWFTCMQGMSSLLVSMGFAEGDRDDMDATKLIKTKVQ